MALKVFQALEATATLVRDPFDFPAAMRFADAVLETGPMRRLYRRMVAGLSPAELEHLRRLTVTPLDLDALARLPAGTFGHRYAQLFRAEGLDPNAQASAFAPTGALMEKNWIVLRFARVHDMHHVLMDFRTDVPGEQGLQMFNLRNFGEPFALLALLATPVVIARYDGRLQTLREMGRGWRLGGRTVNLFQLPLEEYLARELGEVRRELGIDARRR